MSKKYHVTTTINGDEYEFLCEPQQTLLDVLRDELMLSGTKEGCATGDCGACTVMVDGTMVCSCLVLAVETEGSKIETIEGMAKGERAASAAAKVSGAQRAAMRHLHARHPDRRQGAARAQPRSDRNRDPLLARRQPVPVHRLRQDHPLRAGGGQRNERSLIMRDDSGEERLQSRQEAQDRRHLADQARRHRQGDGPRQVRRRPVPARHAGR